MPRILLINPNTSERTLAMMLAAAAPCLPAGFTPRGARAAIGVPMIVNEADLDASAAEVLRLGLAADPDVAAIIVAAFGDPGAAALRARVRVPVVGIGAAAMLEASAGGRRFGIATTTPGLAGAIERMVDGLGLGATFTGIRLADADPLILTADPAAQQAALERCATACFEQDGADTVIIGGGPLSDAARGLRERFGEGVVEPVPAAARLVAKLLSPDA